MLEVEQLSVVYGHHSALDDVSINIHKGEVVVILGANGAGKSSLLRAIAGLCIGQSKGSISLDGETIMGLAPDDIVYRGIALVPESKAIFGDLNVEENLRLGAYNERARANESSNLDRVLNLFPILRDRRKQITRSMSGGEQQMVAIGRALMSDPSILMLDEPSLGLSPILSKELFQTLSGIRETGLGVLVVEQNAKLSLSIADRGYLIENGHIVGENDAASLSADPSVQSAYLGTSNNYAGPDLRLTSSAQPSGALSHHQTNRTFVTPTSQFTPAAGAQELIGESLEDLICRASDFARQASEKSSDSQNVYSTDAQELAGSQFAEVKTQPSQEKVREMSGPTSIQKWKTQKPDYGDDRISNMLVEFEEAANHAQRWRSNGHQQRFNNNPLVPPANVADLPEIPVFRKSRVKIFKRDETGVLVKLREV